MHSKHRFVLVALLLSLGAVFYLLVRTSRDPSTPSAAIEESGLAVDGSSLGTAQQLVRLPTLPDERPLAEDALRLGDKEMDLAFADAVREVAMHPHAASAEVTAMAARLRASMQEQEIDSAQVVQLAATAARASASARGALDDRLNLARAHLELVSDEVDDAEQDLLRAGGDPQGRIQQMMREHDELSKSSDSTRVNLVAPVEVHGLVRHVRAWLTLHAKQDQLRAAGASANAAAISFARRHDLLEASMRESGHDSVHASLTHAASAALLLDTQRQAVAQKTRGTLDQHVSNQRHLAETYARWADVVRGQQMTAVNRALRSVAVILCIILAGVMLAMWFERVFGAMSADRRRTRTVYMVLRVSLQVIGVMLILLVAFGLPDNLGTVLGLAGAGLTVALKDFILAFCGWFVLMGRDGIGIGDLVEINGVTGEVQEIGLFHTALLETGNWVDSGYHTGRRVTFSNSFAVEKHYFNFSTNGRWLWDEVRFVVPAGGDQTHIVEAIRQRVNMLTQESATHAEAELNVARRGTRMSAVSTAPAIHFRPIVGGVEVVVRYLTTVRERGALRAQLYETAIALLGERAAAV